MRGFSNMYSAGACDICGLNRGRGNHDACSKKRQAAHKGEKHRSRPADVKELQTIGFIADRKGI
jgi:hypothetical protein